MIPLEQREWTHVGGDLEASYDGHRYVDVRVKDTDKRIFVSKGATEAIRNLFPAEFFPWWKRWAWCYPIVALVVLALIRVFVW